MANSFRFSSHVKSRYTELGVKKCSGLSRLTKLCRLKVDYSKMEVYDF